MKRAVLGLVLAALTLCGVPAWAQTTLTSTTLSAAITNASDRTMTLASTTGVSASTASTTYTAVIDREVVVITSVNTTTGVVGITRGQSPGLRATGHASGATVYIIPPGNVVLSNFDRAGSCSATSGDYTQSSAYVPVINPQSGYLFTCTSSRWVRQVLNAGALITIPTTAGGMPVVIGCGATTGNANCGNTGVAGTARIYMGDATLASNAAVITFPSAYTGTSTYTCVANDLTTRANPVQMASTSTTTATITNTTGASDVIRWVCVGY